MAFRDFVAYLPIKIWIKSKLPKITLQPKIGLVKIDNPNGPIATKKIEPNKRPKIQPERPKIIGPVTTCSLCNIASISHISLVLTPNCDMFEALDS